jgi:hypothetical protein
MFDQREMEFREGQEASQIQLGNEESWSPLPVAFGDPDNK